MTGFSPANPKQGIGLLGASEKLRKGSTDGELGQPISFARIMGQACHITTQATIKMAVTSSHSGPLARLPQDRQTEVGSQGKMSKKLDSRLGLGIRDQGFSNSKLETLSSELSNYLKGRGTKTNEALPGKTDLLPESDGQKQTEGKIANLLGGSGLKENGVGKNSRKAGDVPGLLKLSLKKAAIAAKENSAKEASLTEKKSLILAKNNGSGNDIKNLLKHQGLKSIKTTVEHEKTGIKEFSDHKMEVLPKAISSPLYLVDKISSAGEYHHASFRSGGSSAAVNENVNNSGIEPRALIKQIANGLKGPGRVRIMLNPPRLGALDVDVLVRDNKVHIILQAENNDVRHVLQSNVDSLKSSLRSHGLIADNVNVLVQEKPDGANYGSGQNETLFRESRNRERNEEGRTKRDSPDHVSPSQEEENQGVRIDGRVSLFA